MSVSTVTQSGIVAEEPVSIAHHAAYFGPKQMNEALENAVARETKDDPIPVTVETPTPETTPETTPEPQEPRGRHRARSQQARAEDVPRIQALTARAKAAEDERESLRQELHRLKSMPSQPTAPAVQATMPVAPAAPATGARPKPLESQVGTDYETYGDYIEALSDWKAEQVYDARQQKAEHARQQAEQTSQQAAWLKTWEARWDASKQRHPDFEQVVADQPLKVGPALAVVDQFIRLDDNGTEILYHLRQHPEELDSLHAMSGPVAQAKALTLLSQRLESGNGSQAGSTGAAAPARPYQPPPRPPTPVRTEAQRASGTPPPTDGSLSLAEHRAAFWKKAR